MTYWHYVHLRICWIACLRVYYTLCHLANPGTFQQQNLLKPVQKRKTVDIWSLQDWSFWRNILTINPFTCCIVWLWFPKTSRKMLMHCFEDHYFFSWLVMDLIHHKQHKNASQIICEAFCLKMWITQQFHYHGTAFWVIN